MAVVPIRIVGDPVLHTATSPIPVGDDGSLPPELADLIDDLYETMDAANGVGLAANQIGISQRVFVYDCADERGPRDPTSRRGRQSRCSRPPRCRRRCPIPTTTTRVVCRCPASRSRPGRASWARVTGLDADGTPITLEGNGLFARMLQHETGHLDGFLYIDKLIGRHARAAKRTVKSNGWGVPGLSWTPGEDPDPFGH